MLDALHHWDADSRDLLVEGSVGLGHLLLYNTPESRYEQLPYRDPESGLIITADARIDNREELSGYLGMNLNSEKTVPDSLLILESYKQFGTQCTDLLVGAFAFAIWNPTKGKLFCARDHMGFKPFYYYYRQGLFIFASEIKGIKSHKEVVSSMNEQFVADALSSLRSEKDQTFYNEIFRLPQAHSISITPKVIETKRYWELNPNYELKLSSEEEYIALFRKKLEESVNCRLRSDWPIGAELSGGIDSSVIVSLTARKKPIKTFSHSLPNWAKGKHFPYNDETPYSQKIIDYYRIQDHFFITGEKAGILELLRNGLQLHQGVMQGTLSAIFEPLYMKAEKENCRTLLSGYGGDEMVSSHGPGYMYDLVTSFQLRKILNELKSKGKEKNSFEIAKQFIKYFLEINLQRFRSSYRIPQWARDIYDNLTIDPAFIEQLNLKERIYRKLKIPATGSMRLRQYRSLSYDYISTRLEYCSIAAQTHKIEYRYPLLDKRLVEFYLSLPSYMKYHNDYGRYILRKATEGILPPEIQWRTDKTGFIIPGIFLRLKQDQKALINLILQAKNSDIKHYIDYDKTLIMLEKIIQKDNDSKGKNNLQAILNSVTLLMYQLGE